MRPVGVIGAGSFGTALSNLMAVNSDVLVYSRTPEIVDRINSGQEHFGLHLPDNVKATNDLAAVAAACELILPIVPSANFRDMMQGLGSFLRPYHILIHGTKGFDLFPTDTSEVIEPSQIHTMSQVIRQESVVKRVGCLSGPNLSKEILEGQPTATVIASKFTEVIEAGKAVLNSDQFTVFGSNDILGAELAGALKNIIAIGSGILRGKGMGKNLQALLVTRGLREMVQLGKALGSSSRAFFGSAGIGDLVATATSKKSRNFTFGYRLGAGETVEEIQRTMPELAEGVRTLKLAKDLVDHLGLASPIIKLLYQIVYEELDPNRAMRNLMRYPFDVDVDFI